ncbi:MAG: hypothetical protein HRF48_17915 [Chloroflexota bacterium]
MEIVPPPAAGLVPAKPPCPPARTIDKPPALGYNSDHFERCGLTLEAALWSW